MQKQVIKEFTQTKEDVVSIAIIMNRLSNFQIMLNNYSFNIISLIQEFMHQLQHDLAKQLLFQIIKIREELYFKQLNMAYNYMYQLNCSRIKGKLKMLCNQLIKPLSIWIYVLGYEHIKTAKSIYLKGNLYIRMKSTPENLEQAEKLIIQNLEIDIKIMGDFSQDVADCYHSFGKIKAYNKNSNEFEEYFIKSQQILQELYDQSHASIAIIINNFGRSYQDRKQDCADYHKKFGRFKQPYNDYSKSLEIYKEYYEYIIQKMEIYQKQVNSIQNQMIQISQKFLED
ncbi:unnamed protein product [Paramecium pentaurelia]|uniref:Uncharacterized protein n=1 Tax=Paramecium pentaurelia TaxID=43138 RepID=A0A8S1W3M8_9CILI|nr:unnamed protein product [Paramecium pentaurelia]